MHLSKLQQEGGHGARMQGLGTGMQAGWCSAHGRARYKGFMTGLIKAHPMVRKQHAITCPPGLLPSQNAIISKETIY